MAKSPPIRGVMTEPDQDSDDNEVVELLYESDSDSDDDDLEVVLSCPEGANKNQSVFNFDVSLSYTYDIVETPDIVTFMRKEIDEVNNILKLPRTTARLLLQHFSWNKEKLLESFYVGGEAEQVELFKNANIVNPESAGQTLTPVVTGGAEETECGICLAEINSSEFYGIACGHRYCSTCWDIYLTTKIQDEGMGQSISCIAHNCNILVDDSTVMVLVSDPQVKLKYQQLVTNSYIECNRFFRWCPFPNCTRAVRILDEACVLSATITCKCDNDFCFDCGDPAHDPISCKLLKTWLDEDGGEDSMTNKWMLVYTKRCPFCKASIEKNGGCNHMRCRVCHQEFCWLCCSEWSRHKSSCHIVDDASSREDSNELEKGRDSLKRYMKYKIRHDSHKASLNLESKLWDQVDERMKEMIAERSHLSLLEIKWVKESVRVLIRCRRLIMNTYVFAYFVKRNERSSNQIAIFEGNLENLAVETEKLSGILEKSFWDCDLMILRKAEIQNVFSYCDKRHQALLEHVHEGHQNEWWEFLN